MQLRRDVRRAAGRIAELGGWIARDSGDRVKAEQLTMRAEDHLRAADPTLRAMIWMRRLNILLTNGPDLARERRPTPHDSLGPPVGRLAASIARQQAFAAVADRDRASFLRYAAHAVDVAETEPAEDDHAIYAIRAYVVAEVASGLIAINQPAKALELLLEHQNSWQPASSTQRSRLRGSTGPSKSVVNTNPLSVHST